MSEPPLGITPELIDRLYDEVSVSTTFVADEQVELTYALQRLFEKVQRVTLRTTGGSPESAKKVAAGFLFAHRLLRESDPGFVPRATDYGEILGRVQSFSTAKRRGAEGEDISFFPVLESAFEASPATYDHLLNTFSNEDTRWGAQVLLLACMDQIVVGPAVPDVLP